MSISVKVSDGGFRTLAATDQVALDADWCNTTSEKDPAWVYPPVSASSAPGNFEVTVAWPRYGPQVSERYGVASQLALETFPGDTSFGA